MTDDREIHEKLFGTGQRHLATGPLGAHLISLAGRTPEEMVEKIPADALDAGKIKVTYTNHRGELARRTITPLRVIYGHTEYHPVDQWLLDVWDHEKGALRTYALDACDFTPPAV